MQVADSIKNGMLYAEEWLLYNHLFNSSKIGIEKWIHYYIVIIVIKERKNREQANIEKDRSSL